MIQEMFKTQNAAEYLGLSRCTLEAWRCRGGGPVFCKMGKAIRYRKNDLDDFRDKCRQISTSKVGG